MSAVPDFAAFPAYGVRGSDYWHYHDRDVQPDWRDTAYLIWLAICRAGSADLCDKIRILSAPETDSGSG